MNFADLRKKAGSAGTWGPVIALIVLLAVCCASSESFRSARNLLNITRQVSYSGIIALGMTFVIIGGGIDLAVGSLLALSGCLALMAMNACADPVAGLFVAIGHAPDNGLFAGLMALDRAGYADAGEDCLTRTPGVFVAGDCRSKGVRQLTTAAADGSVAALAACRYLD